MQRLRQITISLTLASALLATGACSQKANTQQAEPESAQQEAKQLADLMYTRETHKQMVTKLTEQLMRSRPALRSARAEVDNFFDEMLDYEEQRDFIIDIYTEEFTASEIQELNAFYQTDLGQKMIDKLPKLMQRANRRMLRKLKRNRDALKEIVRKVNDD
jgi:hypothetical protein